MSVPVLQGGKLNAAIRALKRVPLSRNGKKAIHQMLLEASASGKGEVKQHSPRAARRMRKARERIIQYELDRLKRIMDEWQSKDY